MKEGGQKFFNRDNISLETIPLPVLEVGPDGTVIGCNSMFALQIACLSQENICGKNIDDLFADCAKEIRQLLTSEKTGTKDGSSCITCKIVCRNSEMQYFKIMKSFNDDKNELSYTLFFVDITPQHKAEADFGQKDILFKLMNACNQELIRSTDKTDLLMRICQIMVEIGGYHSIWVGMTDEKDHLKPFAQWSVDDKMQQLMNLKPEDTDYNYSPAGMAIKTQASFIIQNLNDYKNDFKWKAHAIESGIKSVASIPFYIGDSYTGVMIVNSTAERHFGQDKVIFFNDLAENITYGISYIDIFFEMKYVEQQLRQNEQKFRSVVYELVDGVAISDESGKIIVWNNSMEHIVGIAEPEMMNKYIWDFQNEITGGDVKSTENYNKIKVKLQDYLRKGVPQKKKSLERKIICRTGETKVI